MQGLSWNVPQPLLPGAGWPAGSLERALGLSGHHGNRQGSASLLLRCSGLPKPDMAAGLQELF